MATFLGDFYREQRYLESATDQAIASRLTGLLSYLAIVQIDGSLHVQARGDRYACALANVVEELRLREIDYARILSEFQQRITRRFDVSKAFDIRDEMLALSGQKCLFKFTQSQFSTDLMAGQIRFTRASKYIEEGFDIAIRDDELNMEHVVPGLRLTTMSGDVIPIRGNRVRRSAGGDYFVSCFTVGCDLKLFNLFNADACVAIQNAEAFADAVRFRYRQAFPGDEVLFGAVKYVDPFRQLMGKRPIEFAKSIDYEYEKEFRFVSYNLRQAMYSEEVRTISVDMQDFGPRILTW